MKNFIKVKGGSADHNLIVYDHDDDWLHHANYTITQHISDNFNCKNDTSSTKQPTLHLPFII